MTWRWNSKNRSQIDAPEKKASQKPPCSNNNFSLHFNGILEKSHLKPTRFFAPFTNSV